MQIGLTYAYKITRDFFAGIQRNLDYKTLGLAPNHIASRDFSPKISAGKGWSRPNKATALAFGDQIRVLYNSGDLIKLGASFKSKKSFSEFVFD